MGYKTTGAIQGAPSVRDITAAKTLTLEESGTVFIMNAAVGVAISLPAIAGSEGAYYKFILGQDSITTDWTIVAASAVIEGSALNAGLVALFANETTLSLELGVHTLGDWIEVTSDGTQWHAWGVASVAASWTAA